MPNKSSTLISIIERPLTNDHQSRPPRRVDLISSKVGNPTPSIYQLIQPHQYIDQYIKPKEETIHDVAFFLCTRSAIACNNQIRCFVKNHPRCIQSRSKKLRNLKSKDPVVSILLSCSCSLFQLQEYLFLGDTYIHSSS